MDPVIGNFESSDAIGVAIALGLGLLVGVQRGWTLRNKPDGSRFAGIRTFGLFGLLGGLAGVLYPQAPGPATILLGAAAAFIIYGYYKASRIEGLASGTTGMAGLLTLACGFMVGGGEWVLGTSVVVVMVLLLAMREQLHAWVGHLSQKEVTAIARFAVIALVILPLLPDTQYGPYGAWNPRQLWMVVVLVSGFSFAGYFASRMLGPSRANLATAAAGSVVSSTAVTAALAAHMRDGEGDPSILAAAVSLAGVVMNLRVLVLVGVLAQFALPSLALLVVPSALTSLAATAWYLRIAQRDVERTPAELSLRNPFDILPALLLAALVMVMTVLAHWVLAEFGDQGLALVLAISGTVDVDSAIITMGSLPTGMLDPRVAGLVLAIPVTLNTLFKAGVAVSIAGWRGGRRAAFPLIASAIATGLAYLLIP
jgi:uncharacterized membrane protein (DUF4010 family)